MSVAPAGLAAFDAHFRGIFGKSRWKKLLVAMLQQNGHVIDLVRSFTPLTARPSG